MFFAHTLRHLLVEDVHFLFLGPPENFFSRVRESGLRDEHAAMRVAHGNTMVSRETQSE
jgi:hypothetical protein